MNYCNISEDLSYLVRDASLELAEDRHLMLMQDPGQRWISCGRQTVVNSNPDLLDILE